MAGGCDDFAAGYDVTLVKSQGEFGRNLFYTYNDGSGGGGGGTENANDKKTWSGRRGFISGINGDMEEEELHKALGYNPSEMNITNRYYWSAGYSLAGRWEEENGIITPKGNARLNGGEVSNVGNYGAGGRRVLWWYW